jgi:proteic killer suppression protein
MAIKSFKSKSLKNLFEDNDASGISADLVKKLIRQLDTLESASLINDLNFYRVHPLKGNRKGTWAIVVNKNWRITFIFKGEDAYDVDLEDYH